MNIKRILAVFAILSLIITSGCDTGGYVEKSTSDPDQEQSTSSEADSSHSEQNQSASSEGEAADTEKDASPERPVIGKAASYTRETNEGSGKVYVEGNHDTLYISKDSRTQYKELAAALDQIMNDEKDAYDQEVKEYRKEQEESSDSAANGEVPYMLEEEICVRRSDQEVLSFVETGSSYTGGAHGVRWYTAHNLDAASGKEISLKDVIKDQNLLQETLKEELQKKYGEELLLEDLDENIKNLLEGSGDSRQAWTLDPQGITFYYSNYDIASYAGGTQNVTILYSSHEDLFTDRYHPLKGEGYISGLFDYDGFSVDTDEDGEAESISVINHYGDDGETIEGFDVTAGDQTLTVNDLYVFDTDLYTVHTSYGKSFLYIWCSEESDWMTLHLYDISSGKLVSAGTMNVSPNYMPGEEDADGNIYEEVITNPNKMALQTRFDILSTYEAKKTYQVNEDPMPVSSDPYYIITSNITLKSVKDVTGDLVDEEGNVVQKSVTIPSESSFTLYRTDGDKQLDTKLADGRLLRLTVEGTYPPYVNGIDANELFEELFYAG